MITITWKSVNYIKSVVLEGHQWTLSTAMCLSHSESTERVQVEMGSKI